jgi:hypothetical protein
MFGRAAQAITQPQEAKQKTFKPAASTGGWPPAAIIDWESWGHKNPPRFFAKWPELGTGGVSKSGGPSH